MKGGHSSLNNIKRKEATVNSELRYITNLNYSLIQENFHPEFVSGFIKNDSKLISE